ncbi:MAG: hypothetical protein WBE13_23525 [Candidatus Acidiferrum sp.]
MKKSIRAIFLFCAFGVPTVIAQQNPPVSQETVLTFVHDLLQVFYPELISKGHRLKLSVLHPADASWREISGVYFTVFPDSPPDYGVPRYMNGQLAPEVRPDPNTILLDGRVWLPPLKQGSRVQEVFVNEEANKQKLETLCKSVESHSDWSDAQVISALKQAGARFGPDDKAAFIRSLPFDKTERFLGHIRITSVEFRLSRPDPTNRFGLVSMFWSVRAVAQFSDGSSSDYIFAFEPFEGKLTLLSRMG